MTRINAAISPKVLSDKHLQAEFFELPRVLTYAEKYRPFRHSLPKEFTLGPGHVKFFAGKLMFLHERYMDIYAELKERGVKVDERKYKAVVDRFRNCGEHLYHNWKPTSEAFYLLICRLFARTDDNDYRSRLCNSVPYITKPIICNMKKQKWYFEHVQDHSGWGMNALFPEEAIIRTTGSGKKIIDTSKAAIFNEPGWDGNMDYNNSVIDKVLNLLNKNDNLQPHHSIPAAQSLQGRFKA